MKSSAMRAPRKRNVAVETRFREFPQGALQEYGSYVKRFAHFPHYLSAMADAFEVNAREFL